MKSINKKWLILISLPVIAVLYTNMGANPIVFNNINIPLAPPVVNKAPKAAEEAKRIFSNLVPNEAVAPWGNLKKQPPKYKAGSLKILERHLMHLQQTIATKNLAKSCSDFVKYTDVPYSGRLVVYPTQKFTEKQMVDCTFGEGPNRNNAFLAKQTVVAPKHVETYTEVPVAYEGGAKKMKIKCEPTLFSSSNGKTYGECILPGVIKGKPKPIGEYAKNHCHSREYGAGINSIWLMADCKGEFEVIVDESINLDLMAKDEAVNGEAGRKRTFFVPVRGGGATVSGQVACGGRVPVGCASGENRIKFGVPINYLYGSWGGLRTNYGTVVHRRITKSSSGNTDRTYCYHAGQKQDRDGTDLIVGYFCKYDGKAISYSSRTRTIRTGDDR